MVHEYNILIVDDEKHVRTLIHNMLNNYLEDVAHIDEAGEVSEALLLCQKKKYELIITDIKLPEITGIEFIKRLRLRGVFTPILIVSAYATPEDISEACKYGPFDYLAKPFTHDELRSKVRSLLEHKRESFERYLREAEGFVRSSQPGDLEKAENLVRMMFYLMPSSPVPHYLMSEILKKRNNNELAERHRNAGKALDTSQAGDENGEDY